MDIILKTAKWIIFSSGARDYTEQVDLYANYLSYILDEKKKQVIKDALNTMINTLSAPDKMRRAQQNFSTLHKLLTIKDLIEKGKLGHRSW